jgi:hypothetical protein
MGGDGGGGILQHRCGRGKRELSPIWEWRSSEGAHRRGGRQQQRLAKSGARERPPVARGQQFGHGNGGEGGGAREGGQSGVGDEGFDEWRVGRVFERARSAARLRGKKERRGGVQPWGCHAAWGQAWGLAPTGGWRPDRGGAMRR